MKKMILAAAFVAGTVSFSLAQGQGQGGQQRTPEERAKMSVERMKTAIPSLSADQEAKLVALNLAQNKAQQDLQASVTTKITAVLTDDQKKTYTAYVAERGNRGGFGGGGFGGGQRPGGAGAAGGTPPSPEERAKASVDRLKTAASLTLTADQESKIVAIMLDQNKAQADLMTANSTQTLAVFNDSQKKEYETYLASFRNRVGGQGQGGGAPRPAGQ